MVDQSTQVSFSWKGIDSYIAVLVGARRKTDVGTLNTKRILFLQSVTQKNTKSVADLGRQGKENKTAPLAQSLDPPLLKVQF